MKRLSLLLVGLLAWGAWVALGQWDEQRNMSAEIDADLAAHAATADPHTGYFLVSGTRAMTGNANLGGNAVTNINFTSTGTNAAHVTPASGQKVEYILKVGSEWRNYEVFHDGSTITTNYSILN